MVGGAGSRIPAPYLDGAVVNGIQKRLAVILNEDLLRRILLEKLGEQQPAEDLTGRIQEKLAGTRQQIRRLVDALAQGADLSSVKDRLGDLEQERGHLEGELERIRAAVLTRPEDLNSVINDLIGRLGQFGDVLKAGSVEEQRRWCASSFRKSG
jgi:hypothetical protein